MPRPEFDKRGSGIEWDERSGKPREKARKKQLGSSILDVTKDFVVYATTDVTVNNSETLVSTGMTYNVPSGTNWVVDGVAIFENTSSATPDVKVALIYTASGGSGTFAPIGPDTTTADTSATTINIRGVGAGTARAFGVTTSQNTYVHFKCFITGGSADGNADIQFAQNTANASNTVFLGGWMRASRVE